MDPFETETTVECRSAPQALWAVLADTERLNRAVGMGKVALRPLDDASAARFLATTELAGFPVEYEERPFEWVYPESFGIQRRMRSGPMSVFEMHVRLTPQPSGGTQVTVGFVVGARDPAAAPGLQQVAEQTLQSFALTIRQLDAELVAGARLPSPHPVHDDALAHAASALASETRSLVDQLVAFVRDADDLEVGRIRPFALADAWGVDRRALLGTCLAAVRAGLLVLHWEVVCPSCRTATEVIPTLSSLSDHGTCQLCEIQFAVDLDEAVEATFSPTPAIRAIDLGPYCSGGPARTPHVLAQAILPARGEARLRGPIEAGHYRLFVRGGAAIAVEVALGAPPEVRVETKGGGVVTLGPGGAIVVENPGEESHAKIELVTWTDQAAKARIVMTMPGFRRDFSRDILRPGMALKVARVGLFFSDLTGSTQLYNDTGDAAAFRLVQDHFEMVIALIERSSGTLVKTIGDAVMAAFSDDLDGLVASVAMLHAFEEFRRSEPIRQRTHLKLGVFGGPCYAVTANGMLDYFGQTVNIAARLQAEARSGELVVTEELVDRAIEKRAIPPAFVHERYAACLKGVTTPLRVARLRIPG